MKATRTFSSQQPMPPFILGSDVNCISTTASELLVQMIKSNSEKGFHILYDKYCDALYGILLKFVKRNEVADDLLQDTFVKIWKNIEKFDSTKGTLFTWMLNIARNLAIDYLRSSAHQQQLQNLNVDLFSLNVDYIGAKSSLNKEIEFRDFKNNALKLESKYAEVIDLIFFYGYTHEQTAEKLNLPLGTIKTRARKALEMLKILYQY